MDINIFTQIGFVVLVGLASKNAILIVEFAKHQREAGMTASEAAIAACRLRLRPIVMTSFAFILGVSPLMIAVGAGSRDAAGVGNGRLCRHARSDAVRDLPHAGLLHGDRPIGEHGPVPPASRADDRGHASFPSDAGDSVDDSQTSPATNGANGYDEP